MCIPIFPMRESQLQESNSFQNVHEISRAIATTHSLAGGLPDEHRVSVAQRGDGDGAAQKQRGWAHGHSCRERQGGL
jgi:hypothetical protein